MVNHVVECVFPWLMFSTSRGVLIFAGLAQIGFQGVLILSGNLSFLNWLTMAGPLFCLDDGFWLSLCPWAWSKTWYKGKIEEQKVHSRSQGLQRRLRRIIRLAITGSYSVVLIYCSWPVVLNLLSNRQVVNVVDVVFRIDTLA